MARKVPSSNPTNCAIVSKVGFLIYNGSCSFYCALCLFIYSTSINGTVFSKILVRFFFSLKKFFRSSLFQLPICFLPQKNRPIVFRQCSLAKNIKNNGLILCTHFLIKCFYNLVFKTCIPFTAFSSICATWLLVDKFGFTGLMT